jgi:hypothetical protein
VAGPFLVALSDENRIESCRQATQRASVKSQWVYVNKRRTMDNITEQIISEIRALSNAITPTRSVAGEDVFGTRVSSLTEAVIGMTAGLQHIGDAIYDLSQAVRERD